MHKGTQITVPKKLDEENWIENLKYGMQYYATVQAPFIIIIIIKKTCLKQTIKGGLKNFNRNSSNSLF